MATSKITLFPVQQEIELEPGEIYEGYVTIVEPVDAEMDFDYKVQVVPYQNPSDETEIVLTKELDRLLMADWITLSDAEGTLKPNETKKIPFRIEVPENAPSGGQYATIFASSKPSAGADGAMNVQNVVGINSVIYAKVAGVSRHETELVSESMPGFSTSNIVDWEFVVKNNGNIHEQIKTEVTIKNAITGEQVFPKEGQDNEQSNLVMPGTMRILLRHIDTGGSLGIYNVSEEVSYGDNNYSFSRTVTVCPVWFMGLVALTLGVLIWTIVKLMKRHQKSYEPASPDAP